MALMAIATQQLGLILPGGRDLEVVVDGPTDGLPLLFHYGTPSAALSFPPLVAEATRRRLRTIVYSRPGYAASTEKRGRSVADAVEDVSAILDEVEAPEFVTIGWSGGGPHALACAAMLPDRCLAAVSLAGVAPYGADGLDWMAGMGPENVEEFGLALEGDSALSPWLEQQAEVLSRVEGPEVAASLGGLISEVDKGALTGSFADFLAQDFRKSVSSGIAGWRDDDLAFVKPWGFELGQIRKPVAVWQGEQDRMVPFTHGQWLAAHIPDARVRLYPAEGHLSLAVTALGRILDDLLAIAGRAP